MEKDWTGNKKTTFSTLGASSHSEHDREVNDYYAIEPIAAKCLLELEPDLENIWECACGEGHLAEVFKKADKLGWASDLIERGYGDKNIDFLRKEDWQWSGDIVTNPPYKFAKEFIEKAIASVQTGRKVCMFLKLTFLEGKARKDFFENYPPKSIYVSSSRIKCALNGNFAETGSSAVAYGWYVWEKGYKGKPQIEWFN